ncbi:MAG TPA: vWA domain-containing protein [Longimicrobium sp.]|nr:vWA domain-containing protein [Longimicrobium sp.]
MSSKRHPRTLKELQRCGCCEEERPDPARVKPPELWTRTEALAIAKTLRLKANEAEKRLAEQVLGALLRQCERKGCFTEIYEMLGVARRRLEAEGDADADTASDFDDILDGDGTRVQYETDHFIIDYTVDAGTADQVQDPTSDTAVNVTLQDGTLIGTTVAGIGVPDFVKMLGIWLEYYLQQFVSFGFNDPTDDGMGGIAKLDVSIRTGGSGTGPGSPIGIENILGIGVGLAGFYNDTGNGLGVTPGHELFHQVQYTYNSGGATFLKIYKEGTARWAEDSVNDAYNRYNMEVPDYLNNTTVSLISYAFRYETVILWKYLSEQKGATLTEPQHGVDALLLLWQNLVGAAVDADGIAAIDNTVQALDAASSVYDLFAQFSVAVYLKDLAAPYPDAAYEFLEDEEPRNPGGQVYTSVIPLDAQNLDGLSPGYTDTGTCAAWGLRYYVFDLDTTVQSVHVAATADAAFTGAFYRVLEIRGGAATVHEGSGANYTADLLTDITDAVTPRIDQVVVIVGAYETGGNYELAVSVNGCVPSVVLVIDHSGSMALQGKMAAAIDAATLFVDMAEANGVRGLGAVGFSTTAAVLANSELEALTAGHADDVRASLAALGPTQLTSIGDGLQKAWDEFDGDPVVATREVIVLLTDGMENQDPMIDAVDDTLVANGIQVFPVGLGEDWGIQPEKLEDLALLTGGDFRMTSDPAILEEFYLQILADNLCADMDGGGDADADADTSAFSASVAAGTRIAGGRKIHAVSSDTRLNVVLTWNDAGNETPDLAVAGPGGLVITQANAAGFPGVKYRRGARYAFFTIDLPVAGRREGTWYGYPVNLSAGGGVVRAFLVSGLAIDAGTTEETLYTGEPIAFTCRVQDRGRAVGGLKVTVTSDQPLYSYGNVMAEELQYPAAPAVQGDPVPDTHAKMAALLRAHGAGLLPRDVNTFALKEAPAQGPGRYANALFAASNPGSYHFTVRVEGSTPDGDYCVRYVSFTKVVRPRIDSASSGFVLTPLPRAAGQYTLAFTPIDRLGNLLGPGYGGVIRVNANQARVLTPVRDLNNGTYSLQLAIDPARIATTTVSIVVKDQVVAVPRQVLVSTVAPPGTAGVPAVGRQAIAFWIALFALLLALLALILVIAQ